MSTPSTFSLVDKTSIPWLAWGCGSGKSKNEPVVAGRQALAAGIHHIDTAQIYGTEAAVGQVIKETIDKGEIKREDLYITTKLGQVDEKPISTEQIRPLIEESIKKLGTIPNLLLIHNPYVAKDGELKKMWNVLEDMKAEGRLQSIGVSNFRVQDFEQILDGARVVPVVNQIELHPYTLTHLKPLLEFQKKKGIVTQSYGTLSPLLRHPDGGPLKRVIEGIAKKLAGSGDAYKGVDAAAVLLLWAKALNAVVITASGNTERIKGLATTSLYPDLSKEDVDEITAAGKGIHYRFYSEHMEKDFPVPDLPNGEGL